MSKNETYGTMKDEVEVGEEEYIIDKSGCTLPSSFLKRKFIDKVVKIDYKTYAGDNGRFTRLVVLVDLHNALVPCIGIDNFT
ncbi:hypothetical protein V6N11_018470 [Hibiscus sabdariffa]|uniref:Uncharacterized protein n=1 Tax=Hibiscus sabdariffa TaxID=183260 RepID=A0ABR2T7U3_9ROSI